MSQYSFKHIAKLYKNNSSNSIKQFLRDFLLRKLQKLKKNEALPPEEELNYDVIFTKSNKEEVLFLVAFANLFRQAMPDIYCNYFFLPLYSSETVSFARPFARRAANTRRPFFVAILSRKPCLFFLFLLEGWNVLFIVYILFYVIIQSL